MKMVQNRGRHLSLRKQQMRVKLEDEEVVLLMGFEACNVRRPLFSAANGTFATEGLWVRRKRGGHFASPKPFSWRAAAQVPLLHRILT